MNNLSNIMRKNVNIIVTLLDLGGVSTGLNLYRELGGFPTYCKIQRFLVKAEEWGMITRKRIGRIVLNELTQDGRELAELFKDVQTKIQRIEARS